MKVLDITNKIKNLEALKTSVLEMYTDNNDILGDAYRKTVEDAAEAIDGYIDELMHKEVKM